MFFVRYANILCRCFAVHFVYMERYLCGATDSQYSTATVILISLSFHLAWQFMLINNGKYCRDNLCNKERLYIALHESISRLAQFLYIYNTEDMIFPRQIIFSRILLLCLCLVVLIALRIYLFLYTGIYVYTLSV